MGPNADTNDQYKQVMDISKGATVLYKPQVRHTNRLGAVVVIVVVDDDDDDDDDDGDLDSGC
jgi:hypothetical protein